MTMNFHAFIPARSGSKRIHHKNMCKIGDKTLIQIAVEACLSSPDIQQTFIVTDSPLYDCHAQSFGAQSLGIRPSNLSSSTSSDREWLLWALTQLSERHNVSRTDNYVIVRTTSPFRTSTTLSHACQAYKESARSPYACLRSIKPVSEHPGKMWIVNSPQSMSRLLPFNNDNNNPWSDCQSNTLPKVYVQNASLEIGNVLAVLENPNFPTSGFITIPFIMTVEESLDINTPEDLQYARYLNSKHSTSGNL